MSLLTIQPAAKTQLSVGLQILFQHLPLSERQGTIARVQQMFARGELDLDGLLVARSDGKPVGALLTNVAPGAVGLVWPPRVLPGRERVVVEDGLLEHARTRFRSRGVKLAQALLMPDEAGFGRSLERNGFPHITRLWFLRHHLELSAVDLSAPEQLTFGTYRPRNPERFVATLLRTYEGTQDCPELNGVRTVDEILAGHRAQGSFNPEFWWLASAGTEPVGVLLVNPAADQLTWELVYLGVVPEVRGRSFGRQLVRKALCEAKLGQAQAVTLSVDARNQPAQQIYHQLGFEVWDRREVYLAIIR